MPKKISECTKAHLISVPLPNHAATYTVISHQFVIDYAYQALANAGFGIVEEEYRCTADGQIAQGIYKLQFMSDPELSMMFAWTNSYNKQVKFKCVVGAYINNTGSVMISGEVGSWVRKHMGTADTETKDTIDKYISNAHMYYDQLCLDKATMEGVTLNTRKQAQLLGVLFAEYGILTTEQASLVRDQMKKPTHVFADSSSLWAFYNYVTIALQLSHPKTWMEDQRILHYFISTIANFNKPATPVQSVVAQQIETEVVDPLYAIPGQTNILDQIAEVETQVSDNQVVQEEVETEPVLHQSEEVVEEVNEAEELPFDIDADDDAVLDAILTPIEKPELELTDDHDLLPPGLLDEAVMKYTDAAGNTFEAPIVPSIQPTPADYEMMEAMEFSEGTPAEANLDNIPVEKKQEIIVDSFDLDFDVSDETEESADDIPDFF
jgi:hypothetical protein